MFHYSFYVPFRSPPRMLNSCLNAQTPNDYSSKQLSLSPVSTPSKVVTDSNYVGSLSELEGFHVLDIKTDCNDELDMKYIKKLLLHFYEFIQCTYMYVFLDHFQ